MEYFLKGTTSVILFNSRSRSMYLLNEMRNPRNPRKITAWRVTVLQTTNLFFNRIANPRVAIISASPRLQAAIPRVIPQTLAEENQRRALSLRKTGPVVVPFFFFHWKTRNAARRREKRRQIVRKFAGACRCRDRTRVKSGLLSRRGSTSRSRRNPTVQLTRSVGPDILRGVV